MDSTRQGFGAVVGVVVAVVGCCGAFAWEIVVVVEIGVGAGAVGVDLGVGAWDY